MDELWTSPQRLVFVGGKGGVGKSTCSSSVACILAEKCGSALLISTDPAHNLGDVFEQKFSGEPTPVASVKGLSVLEINPTRITDEELAEHTSGFDDEIIAEFREWLTSVPGIDEAMAIATVLEHIDSGQYAKIVFDTAPTGHTLRLLKLPDVLKAGIEKLNSWKAKLGGMIETVSMMFSTPGQDTSKKTALQKLSDKLNHYRISMEKVSAYFKDPQMTTFVCVCIAELLSVEETKRLVHQLTMESIHTKHIFVNQLVPKPPEADSDKGKCEEPTNAQWALDFCTARRNIQQKYIQVLQHSLAPDMQLVGLPQLATEIHGTTALAKFMQHLVDPANRIPSLVAPAPAAEGDTSSGSDQKRRRVD